MQQKPVYSVVFILTLVHFTGDFYSSFFSPLLPAFVDKLGLTLAQVGLITGAVRFLSFIVQPVTGYLADRYETRGFVFGGLFLAFFTIPFSGIAPNYWTLFLILCLGSIGSSIFHPATTGMVPLFAGNRTGLCLSIYNTGGTLAFALGPAFITVFVATFGLENMPYTAGLGAIAFLFCLKALPSPASENLSSLGFFGSFKKMLGHVYKTIFLIWLVMVMRAVAGQTFMTFMPIHLADQGFSIMAIGRIYSVFVIAGTASGLLAGYLADRLPVRWIFFTAHLLMMPCLLFFLFAKGSMVYPAAFLAGFAILSTLPLGVVLAQRLAPLSRSMVSSLMMGFAYGLGGLISPLVGKLADIYGLENVLFYSAFIPTAALILILGFPKTENTEA